jgi:4,5-dihydroxyphthalate decarboxylase
MIVYGGDYEHTLDVSSTRHRLDFEYRITPRAELFDKVLKRHPFDACEFSLSNYLMLLDQGADWLTAIPVFPNRAFRHGTTLVRKKSALSTFADLAGKRVGIPDYTMTGGVWWRGLMSEHYGLHWSRVEWVATGTPRFDPPNVVRVAQSEASLEDALADGSIDAMFMPRNRDSLLPAAARRFRPLMKDWRVAETDYYRTTGIYPISHVIVIPRASVARYPKLPSALYAAYTHSMAVAKERRLGTSFLPWSSGMWTEVMEVFGDDPVPYGLTAGNRRTIDKLQDYLNEQLLIGRRYDLDGLFESVNPADSEIEHA